MNNGQDIIGRNENFNSIDLDNRFPDYILNNKNELKDWIVN
mgnify:CR=1 FL=1